MLTITPNFAQERALNMLRRDWKSHNTFMVYAPTGSGKTGLAAFIVDGFVSRGMRVLFCAPYTILIGQTANRFVEYGLAHANYLTIQFNLVGVNAEVMTADTPVDERQTIIHRFETGATKIIVSVGVLVAGFDSDVRCIIYARPTKSEIRWLQALGRGLRTAPGKESCLIFDHSGTVHRLGYPDSIEYDDLPGKSDGMEESARRAVEERAEKLPHECSQCHYMKPAGVYVCPKCGHKPLGGEDVDTDTGRKLTKLGKNQHLPTKAEKQAWWSQIKFYQRQRVSQGKKPVSDAWCAHTFREKFGEWPNDLSDFPMEITSEVSNYIRHKLIRYAKGKGKAAASAETASPIPDSDITHKVISAKRQVENIRSMLGRRTA
ncbi:hypothetical protein AG28_01075 [Salmonella enterica subsp. enterica]|nr:hypothetical protein [Salmonella enterica]ECG1132568.1 hypothetical protein [Salmonella enterica subsp. enterica]